MTNPEDTGRMIGYARVSTADQSVTMQVEALMRAGAEREFIFYENASGSKKDRPRLRDALRCAGAGDTLVVWKLDRIARSISHLLEIMEDLEARGVKFRSLTEGIDTTTPVGRLLFHVISSLAEFERDLIRERTRAGVEAAKARGVRFGARKQVSDAQIAKAWKRVHEGKVVRGRLVKETRVAVAAELGITTHQLARRFKEHEAAVAAEVAAARPARKVRAKKKAMAKRRSTKR